MMALTPFLDVLRGRGGTDLLLQAGCAAWVRRGPEVRPVDGPPLTAQEVQAVVEEPLGKADRQRLYDTGDVAVVVESPAFGRFRLHVMRVQGCLAAIVRALPSSPPPLDALGVPADLFRAASSDGLTVVAGPARSGRTTTLAALLQTLARKRSVFVLSDLTEIPLTSGTFDVTQYTCEANPDRLDAGLSAARHGAFGVVALDCPLWVGIGSGVATELARSGRSVLVVVTAATASDARRAFGEREPTADMIRCLWQQRLIPMPSGGLFLVHGLTLFDGTRRELFEAAEDIEFDRDVERRQLPGEWTLNQSLEASYRTGVIALQQALVASPSAEDLQEAVVTSIKGPQDRGLETATDATLGSDPQGSGAEDASPYALLVSEPAGTRAHRLPMRRTIVGRSRVGSPDIEIRDLAAAPRHFVLDWREASKRHQLVVWGRGGITVNGALVLPGAEPRLLFVGDVLRIGGAVLRYELAARS